MEEYMTETKENEIETEENIAEIEEDKKSKKEKVSKTVRSGISFGAALAMVISYTTWNSIGWAIIHGSLSWGYVIYFILRY